MNVSRLFQRLLVLAALLLPVLATGGPTEMLERPAGLDDPGWVSLQAAIAKAVGQQAKLVAGEVTSDTASDRFGYSVALDGDTALVGAFRDTDRGSVYVFSRSGSGWTQQALLTANGGLSGDFFGWSVALDGDTALVGARSHDVDGRVDQGATYVFIRTADSWTQQAKLIAADGATGDFLGWSVAIDGDTALIAAYGDDVGATDQGSAYVFTRSGSSWTERARLIATDGAADDFFGVSVALDGGTALVGAASDDVGGNSRQGSAYVFTGSGSSWFQQAQLTAGDGMTFDRFGSSVGLVGDTALVGASGDDVGATLTRARRTCSPAAAARGPSRSG